MKRILKELNLKDRLKARSKNLFFSLADKSKTTQYLPHLITKYYGDPSKKLKLIGITGTNGKTTTTYLIYQALQHLEHKTGLIGTINILIGDQLYETNLTTPKPSRISKLLSKMVKRKCSYCVMEVSSIGLVEFRVNGLKFSAGVFTNFTQDHMNYHKTMDNYRYAKSLLFQKVSNEGIAVFNRDDPNWTTFRNATKAKIATYGYKDRNSVKDSLNGTYQNIDFLIHKTDLSGSLIEIDGYMGNFKLLGKFNAYNLAAAYTTLCALGLDKEKIFNALTKSTPPPGRLQLVNPDYDVKTPKVIVDYAHTPDALENVLITLRDLINKKGRLVTVFGCGGDRDKLKRAEMGRIANKYSDKVMITSDNPRSEDPESIIKDILEGIENTSNILTEISRKEAITRVIKESSPSDTILIAGKGHESYQEINGNKTYFDDIKIAFEALRFQNPRH